MNTLKDNIAKAPWTAIILAVLSLGMIGVIVVSGYGLVSIPENYLRTAEITLSILVLVGTAGLFFALAFLAAAFAALGMSDRSQALGLPEGSVRSLIALLLITLFVIMSIFLYRQLRLPLQDSIITQYSGITEEQLSEIPSDQIVSIQVISVDGSEEDVFNVERRLPPVYSDQESQRFAQQILTTISTLVVAVAGFYFGTRAVAVSQGAVVSSPLVVRRINPSEGTQGDEIKDVEILGKNFELPKTVKLILGSDEMVCDSILSSPTKIKCKLTIPLSQKVGKYGLLVVNADGGEDQLAEAFEVKQKTE